jgi:hypothetical protein
MTQTTYHDVVREEIEAIAFLASYAVIDYSFLWWHKYAINADFAYWWRMFDSCCVDRFLLFTDSGECYKFKRMSEQYGVDPATCEVVPPNLYDNFVDTRHARIIHSLEEDEAVLSIMHAHFSKPEST